MNKQGQVPAISIIFMLLVGFILWALGLGELLTSWLQRMVVDNNLTGIEAFITLNLPIIIIFASVVFIIVYTSVGR